MTPRGGTGKLRNHWEDSIHKVIRQKICQYMKYYRSKVKGEDVGFCTIIPCYNVTTGLPLEIQFKPAKIKRQSTAQTSRDREGPNHGDYDDDGDDDACGYYYMSQDQPLPVMQPQVNTERQRGC